MSPEYTTKKKASSFFHSSGHHANALQTKHDIVDTTIVIYGLSGIMCEKEIEEPKASKSMFGRNKSKGLPPAATFQTRSMDSKNWSSSTLSSSVGSEDGGLFAESDSNPVTALVSITTSYSAHNMDYETFLPSIPLHCPSINDLTGRYTALWPAFMEGEAAKDQSSFNIVRTMQESRDENGKGHLDSKYMHETVELSLSLSMGTELIPLGTAAIVISGEEEIEVKMNVPARASEQKQHRKHKKKSKTKCFNKDGYFSSDLTKRYFLEENATLRIGVQVITEKAKKKLEKEQRKQDKIEEKIKQKKWLLEQAEKQREEEANRLKELRARMERVTMENTKRRLRMKREIYHSNFDDELDGEPTQHLNSKTRSTSFAPSLMCAMPNMLCAEEATIENRGKSYTPTESLADDYEYAGLESTVSSVSHSMYESEMGSGSSTENETYFTDYEY
ncbi:unnamed protein product [Cylindrotheca closterium]|uniref:Uncharacterized protein n=1 Tax=Cylindrotheca closterium TaxID=2856 RepID=A0AAD2PV85_9STRA|nr:unnamed protein product [Cylindrotheca closterium]